MKTLLQGLLFMLVSTTISAAENNYFDQLHNREAQDIERLSIENRAEHDRLVGYLKDAKIYFELGFWDSGYLYIDDINQQLPPHNHQEDI